MVKEGAATYRIIDLEESERPRERLERLGAGALSKAELIAILLRTGLPGENAVQVGQRLLKDLGDLPGIQRIPFEVLCQQAGVGKAKAAQIKAAIELGNRLSREKVADNPAVQSPRDAADLVLYEMGGLEQEELWVILLDTRNKLIKKPEPVFKGSLNSAQIRIAELFKTAIRANAANLIVVHNHPSGDPTPSPDDVAITRNIIQAGNMLDIQVLDHLVIGQGRFVSLKERGLGFN